MIILILALVVSLVANGILSWYIIQILKKLWTFSDGLKHLLKYMTSYSQHIESVYQMDTFYGDDTLRALLRHSKEAVKFVKQFGEGFMWSDEKEIYQQEAEGEDDDDDDRVNVGGQDFGEEEEE